MIISPLSIPAVDIAVSHSKLMFKIFSVVCFAICILSLVDSSFGMKKSDDVAGSSRSYDSDTFAINLYRALADASDLKSINEGLNSIQVPLTKMTPSDRSIKNFMVIKCETTESIPHLNELNKLFDKMKVRMFESHRIAITINSRPSSPFSTKNVEYDAEFNNGLNQVYGNFARYSFREVVECVNNAQAKIHTECIKGGRVSNCLVSSSACGIYYGFDENAN